MKTAKQKLNSFQKKLFEKEQALKKVQEKLDLLEKKVNGSKTKKERIPLETKIKKGKNTIHNIKQSIKRIEKTIESITSP